MSSSFGKAAYAMSRALADALPDRIVRGVVVTKYGHVSGEPLPGTFEIYEAGHPVPDEQGVAGTERVIDLLKQADARVARRLSHLGGRIGAPRRPFRRSLA